MINKVNTEAFRVPNSIIQGLTTSADNLVTDGEAPLNKLTAFQMVTLLGLMTMVNSKHPQREVRIKPAQLLDIIEVGRSVAHAVDREWNRSDGKQHRRRYRGHRHSPRYVEMIHEALLILFNQTIHIASVGTTQKKAERTSRLVHLLDTFGFVHECDGKQVDPDNLPAGVEKININTKTDDRPVWRIRHRDSDRCWRTTGILFRLNRELTRELTGQHGTIGFTRLARRIFTLFRQYMRSPAMIRLIILILRQTNENFSRHLNQLIEDIGFDATHPGRAISDLEQSLAILQQEELLQGWEITLEQNRITFNVNRKWHTDKLQIRSVA